MNIFKKLTNEVKEIDDALNTIKETSTLTSELTPEPEEEWIWVDGYKGTNYNMQCKNGYQYALGVQHDMPENAEIKECASGFHLCLTLQDVFSYYGIGFGNRFFKVRALVRKTDWIACKPAFQYGGTWYLKDSNKLAAKSIIFTSELTIDEILKDSDAQNLPKDYKTMAIMTTIAAAVDEYEINTLIEDGYSKPFAAHIVKKGKFYIAHAFGSQKDLSMDMKVFGILQNS